MTCLEQPEYAFCDTDGDGVKELIIRGRLLNGNAGQSYQDMYYSFRYEAGDVTYQGRQESLPLGCSDAQLAAMAFAPLDLVYNYSLSQELLNEIARGLGAPADVQVQDYEITGAPSYWEGAGSWTVGIQLWGADGGYASADLVLGSTTTVHMWVPWTYN